MKITVHNKSGASDVYVGATRAAINAWLNSWEDPRNLEAVVRDDCGLEIANKPFGYASIQWSGKVKGAK